MAKKAKYVSNKKSLRRSWMSFDYLFCRFFVAEKAEETSWDKRWAALKTRKNRSLKHELAGVSHFISLWKS